MRKEETVQKKRIPYVSSDNGIVNTPKTGVSRRIRSGNDDKHWDFLDEIEAPLWVDLTLECQSGYNDKDDEWFRISHPFHQCSSRKLISAFAHSAEDCMNMELDILGQSSSKLPPSVSKSRGRDYSRRDRVNGNQMITFNGLHPVKKLNKKSSFVSSESTRMRGSKTSKGRRTLELACSNSDSTGESSLTENAGQQDIRTVPALGDQKFSSNSNFSKKGESSSSITSTLDSCGQWQKNSSEVSSHVLGQSRGFLSALKVSLRKSCVTRQASRVEVTNRRLSEGPKYSSGKSSIGSSSNLGYNKKILTTRDTKDMTPCCRNGRIPVARHQKAHEVNLSKARGGQPHYTNSNPKLRRQSFKSPSINQGNAKVKFQKQNLHAKVLVPRGVNKQCAAAAAVKVKEKAVANNCRIPDGGKENLAGRVGLSWKSSTLTMQKVTTRIPEKSVRTTSAVPKEKIKEQSKGKKIGTMAEKVHFRKASSTVKHV